MAIKLINVQYGQKRLILNEARIGDFLDIGKFEISRLTNLFIKEKIIPHKKDKINYVELAKEYRKYIDEGTVKNQAELSRKLRVSRAWITKVLNRG